MKTSAIPCCAVVVAACLVLAGCSSSGEDETPSEGEYLGLTQPASGFQVRSIGTTIASGADVEFCEVAELPGSPSDTYYVTRMEFGNANFSHHLIVSAAVPGSPADQKLREFEIGERVPCLSAEAAFGNDGITGVGGTQQRYTSLDFPEGVGREYHGGQRVVFDYHYFNTSSTEIEARSAFNFHLGKLEDVTHLARGFGFSNYMIDTPAHQSGKFTAECTFGQDVMVSGLTRHTHRWGADFSVWFEGGESHGEHVWTSTDWQHDVNFAFGAPLPMKQGEGFRFECNFDNTEDRALRFGTNATDEMCILFGLAWNAGADRDVPSQSCDITYADEADVGHAVGASGYPEPSQAEADICSSGAAAGGTPSECTTCQCGSCGHVLLKCATDADCKPILDCVQDPTADCQPVIDAHSSAVGLIQQVGACFRSSDCSSLCEADSAQ